MLDAHPDEGGSPRALARVRDAWDAWAEDRRLHDEGAAALRRRVSRPSNPGSNPGSGSGDEKGHPDDGDDDVFVSMTVYRHPEGARALRDAFARAARPDRLRFGVVWACVRADPDPDVDAESGDIDRLHPRVNLFTRALESEAREIPDDAARASFLASCRAPHLEEQRAAEAGPSPRRTASPPPPRSRVGPPIGPVACERRESTRATRRARVTPGTSRFGFGAGRRTSACVDSSVEFREGWDDALVEELRRAERDVSGSGATGAVLTGYPLGYRRRRVPVLDEDDAVVGHVPGVAGEDDDSDDEARGRDDDFADERERRIPTDSNPPNPDSNPPEIAAVTLRAFGSTLPRPAAARLAPLPSDAATLPALLPNPEFLFARASALVRDAPPDPHAPYLHLGEELSLGARLVTRGWALRLATRCPVRASYDERYRAREYLEDRRAGATLFAADTSDAIFDAGGDESAKTTEPSLRASRRRARSRGRRRRRVGARRADDGGGVRGVHRGRLRRTTRLGDARREVSPPIAWSSRRRATPRAPVAKTRRRSGRTISPRTVCRCAERRRNRGGSAETRCRAPESVW